MLEEEIRALALKEGAVRVGIARRESFAEAPPSAEMHYEKTWADAVISFAVDLGTPWIKDYLGKVTRMGFKKVVFENYHKVFRIGAAIQARLTSLGFEAHNVIPNGIYRPGHTFGKELPDPDLKPPLSLRYMAVGAGVGELGWSGNLLVPGAWSNVFLGAVLTDASLKPDGLLREKMCDGCRICTRVCPMDFMSANEETRVVIGGRENVYNKKRNDYRCFIGCAGYTGLSADGKWSSWSTGRILLPEDDSSLPALYARLRQDPTHALAARNTTFGTRGILDRPFENTNPTCAHCSTVCSGPLSQRRALMDLLLHSGLIEQNQQGQEVVVGPHLKAQRGY